MIEEIPGDLLQWLRGFSCACGSLAPPLVVACEVCEDVLAKSISRTEAEEKKAVQMAAGISSVKFNKFILKTRPPTNQGKLLLSPCGA
jgi:hypothetical protein